MTAYDDRIRLDDLPVNPTVEDGNKHPIEDVSGEAETPVAGRIMIQDSRVTVIPPKAGGRTGYGVAGSCLRCLWS